MAFHTENHFIIQRTLQLMHAENYETAYPLLKQFVEADPENSWALRLLAECAWKLKEHEAAITCYFKLAEWHPDSELISVALFQLLLNEGRDDEAFNEAERFVALTGHSEWYEEIMTGISQHYETLERKVVDISSRREKGE